MILSSYGHACTAGILGWEVGNKLLKGHILLGAGAEPGGSVPSDAGAGDFNDDPGIFWAGQGQKALASRWCGALSQNPS